MIINRTLLRAVDLLGDWLQETIGIPLPEILRFVTTGVTMVIMIHMGMNLLERSLSGVLWSILWSIPVMANIRIIRKYARDVESWEEESVRQRYQTRALWKRENTTSIILRVTFFLSQFLFIAVYLYLHPQLNLSIAVLFFLGWMIVLEQHIECIVPKSPKRRIKTVLVHSI